MIVAYLHPSVAATIVHALHRLPGVIAASFAKASGFEGAGRKRSSQAEIVAEQGARIRVEVMVRRSLEDRIIDAIQAAGQPGDTGTGSIMVLPVLREIPLSKTPRR